MQATSDVVPFEADDRFSKEMLLLMMRSRLPLGKFLMLKLALKSGMSFAQLITKTQKKKARQSNSAKRR